MTKKRILFYTDTPMIGGAENQMLLLAQFLPKEKFEITLACSNYKNLNPWCQQFMDSGANVLRLHVLHKHDPRHFLYIKKLLPQFDLLHLHLWNPGSCRYALFAATKRPVVVTEHDPFPLNTLKTRVKNILMKRVKKIIVASHSARDFVLQQNKNFEKCITVIPNGIDVENWKTESAIESRAEFRRIQFKATPQDKVILCVAELNPRKGQKYLIDAVQLLVPEFPHTKLVFVGDGHERRYYEKRAAPLRDRVLFLGRQKEIAKLMRAADVFVLPSVREAFGLVLLEASISHVPIIATRVGGITEIIEDGKTGILVPGENVERLAEALKNYFTNPQKARAFSDAAHDRAERFYDAKTMAEKTAEVYDEALTSFRL